MFDHVSQAPATHKYPDIFESATFSFPGFAKSFPSTRSKIIQIRCRICRMRVDGSRILKQKVEDSKISGYVWTGPFSRR